LWVDIDKEDDGQEVDEGKYFIDLMGERIDG
jgi:hypothetical protein